MVRLPERRTIQPQSAQAGTGDNRVARMSVLIADYRLIVVILIVNLA